MIIGLRSCHFCGYLKKKQSFFVLTLISWVESRSRNLICSSQSLNLPIPRQKGLEKCLKVFEIFKQAQKPMDAIASDRSDAIESIGSTRCPLTQYWPTWVTIRRCYRIWQVFAKYLSCNRTHGRWVARRPWNFLCFKVHPIERPSTLDLDKTSSRVSTAFTNIFCIVVLIRSMLLIKLLTYRYRSDIDQPISFEATCWRNLFNDRLNILQENCNSFLMNAEPFDGVSRPFCTVLKSLSGLWQR